MTATLLPYPGRTSSAAAVKPLDQFVARLTCAAYEAALKAGLNGPFIEAQLAIWSQIRKVVESDPYAATGVSHEARSLEASRLEAPRRIVFVRAGAR